MNGERVVVFEKNGNYYFMATNLPVEWEMPDYEKIELHLKGADSAVYEFRTSRTPTWDDVTSSTAFFHLIKLRETCGKYIYSTLKWVFFIHMMEKLGFHFKGVFYSDELEDVFGMVFPLEEVR